MTIEEFEKQVMEHRKAYHSGNPIVSDKVYDDEIMYLKSLNPNSPILRTTSVIGRKEVFTENIKLDTLKVVIVGRVVSMTKQELLSILKEKGVTVASEIDETINYVITDNIESLTKKMSLAKEYGIPIISIDNFIKTVLINV